MKIHHCTQQSPEWFELRRGLATASAADRIITPKKGELSAQADDYIAELISHRYVGIEPGFQSQAMLDGIAREPLAREWYVNAKIMEVRQVGLVVTDCGRFGASPDGLVGIDGALEIKCPQAKTHVKYLLDGRLPDEHKCQVHMELFVTSAAWIDFVSYCPPMPALVVRVEPDDFTKRLAVVLESFHEKYQIALAKIEKFTPANLHAKAMPKLKEAASKGPDCLKEAWENLTKETRAACAADLPKLKEQANRFNEQK